MRRLERAGLIQRAFRLNLRGGKAAANNLSAAMATGDIFVVVDADCSFDRHALREILRPLHDDPDVAAVCGNILVRNWNASFMAMLQQVEYLITISLGKTLSDSLGFVTCISGAFGAFRRGAWHGVGGVDVGPGEDFDLTFRLRLAGHRLRFARHAICYTDAPETFNGFSAQRARWERDTFWIRFRKFGYTFNPMHQRFRWSELVNQLDFVIFTLLPALLFPIYLLYLVLVLPSFAPILLLAVTIGLAIVDIVAVLFALLLMGRAEYWALIFLAPISGVFQAYIVRTMRLRDYFNELVFSRSLDDNYVPEKVRTLSTWR
jgi:cellulose synthase/poly-beta-1,6-N-acetylglucosamine synthase-like glycosyltransferase